MDNNCDDLIDMAYTSGHTSYTLYKQCGNNTGECKFGTATCVNGNWGACLDGVLPSAEVCDGMDNNCNGQVDEENVCTVSFCTCDSCSSCNNKLNSGCRSVFLNRSISSSGTCIDNPVNFNNKIFDCQGNTISGNAYGTGIYLENKTNNTIRNCIINIFNSGIYLSSSFNNTLLNNIANSNAAICYGDGCSANSYGIYLSSSPNNTLLNNTANSTNAICNGNRCNANSYGIYLSSSPNNTLLNNTANSTTASCTVNSCIQYGSCVERWASCYADSYGIVLTNSTKNKLTDNDANKNKYGIYIDHDSNNNILNFNNVCSNTNDIQLYSVTGNTGENNTCDKTDGWNDAGKTGCTYSCLDCNNITSISTSNSNPPANTEIGVNCTFTQPNVNCIGVKVGDQECLWNDSVDSWNGNTAQFHKCNAGSMGTKNVTCYFNKNICTKVTDNTKYNACGSNKTAQIVATGDCYCNSCTDCTNKLNDPACSVVKLTADIPNQAGNCISNPANFNNKVFDCQGHIIKGDGTGKGIHLEDKQNNLITNCRITNFSYGIYLTSSDATILANNTLKNNIANNNTNNGISLQGTSYSTIVNNTANYNKKSGIVLYGSLNNLTNNTANNNILDGIYLLLSLDNNLTDNIANNNTRYGIYLGSSSNNTLTNNTANLNSNTGIFIIERNLGRIVYSKNNLLNKNKVCNNVITDINSSGTGNSGANNTCDIIFNWNDAGKTGCTYGCAGKTCSDGTSYSNCSLTKPKYCSNGTLIDNCTKCGCSTNQTCSNSICVKLTSDCNCNSCVDCTNKLNDPACSVVKLTADITNRAGGSCLTNTSGRCIYNPSGFNNKIFDCQGHTILGDHSISCNGIYLSGKSGNTIKNCIITDMYVGINLDYSSGNNYIINNTLNSNVRHGILVTDSSSSNVLMNNTVKNNDVNGIYINYNSNDNKINFNKVCSNTNDIQLYSVTGNTGANNTCDKTDGWNDAGKTGCTYGCAGKTCSDGTSYSNCSLTKPKYCSDGNLIDNCNSCGCPTDQTCSNNICVKLTSDCNCNSCADCTTKLNDPSCSVVKLTADIPNQAGNCISNPANFNNKVFDCQGHVISTGLNYALNNKNAITLDGNYQNDIIKNCVFTYFNSALLFNHGCSNITVINNTFLENAYPISVYASSKCVIENNIINSTYRGSESIFGIYLYDSKDNLFMNNIINNYRMGFEFESGSKNNRLINNTVTSCNVGILINPSNDNNTLINNTANYNGMSGLGIYSSNNILISNTANYNNENGLELKPGYSSATGNILDSNTFCFNNKSPKCTSSFDPVCSNNCAITCCGEGSSFYECPEEDCMNSCTSDCAPIKKCTNYYDISNNATLTSGVNNKCNTTKNLNDTGKTGCTYSCNSADYTQPGSAYAIIPVKEPKTYFTLWRNAIDAILCGFSCFSIPLP